MGVLLNCKPRAEVLEGDLSDVMFAAILGNVLNAKAAHVYQDAATFFDNTHPAEQLKKIVQAVFQRLSDPSEPGAVIRLSTGFGGGKSHALIALWHLAQSISDFSLGTELLPAAQRPKIVRVAAVDGEGAGVPDFATHADATTRSIAGEIAYQFGGVEALKVLGAADSPVASPNASQIEAILPKEPTLILLDEVVTYMAKLDEQGRGNLKGFISALANAVTTRKQAVLVVTDPAAQQAYAKESSEIDETLRTVAMELDQILGRKFSEFDPIKDEGAQVISRRLFEKIDPEAAQAISATYKALYERVARDPDTANLLPKNALDKEFIQRFVVCYPFHPRLIETAQNRLSTMPDYQRGRGTLRLFARLIRDVWERAQDIELIDAGDVDWSSDRIQADLLQRLNRDKFKAVVDADIRQHAAELDGTTAGAAEATSAEAIAAQAEPIKRGHHTRVASALLLESLPMDSNSAMSIADITLATLRPQDAGHEPKEALERLLSCCWYTYPSESGERFRFRIEPNVNRQIDEKTASVKDEDVRAKIRTSVQEYYKGTFFQNAYWPDSEAAVPKTTKPVLVLTDNLELAKSIVQYEGTTGEGHKIPRAFVNNLAVLAPEHGLYQSAFERGKRLIAAQMLQEEFKKDTGSELARKQLEQILPGLIHSFRVEAVRAFSQLVLYAGGPGSTNGCSVHGLTEEVLPSYQPSDAKNGGQASTTFGQTKLREFLETKDLMYKPSDVMDRSLFVERVVKGTPEFQDQSGVYTAAALCERMLSIPGSKLLGDLSIFRNTIRRAVEEGLLVVRTKDGRAFDKEGCVQDGTRYHVPLTGPAPDVDTLVALADSDAAKEWTSIEQPDEQVAPPPLAPPQPANEFESWDEIIEAASTRDLVHLALIAATPTDLAAGKVAAVEVGADSQSLEVEIIGKLKDGGNAAFRLADVSPNHPLAGLANQVYSGVAPGESTTTRFELRLAFGDSGRSEMYEALSRARDVIRERDAEGAIKVRARFRSEG